MDYPDHLITTNPRSPYYEGDAPEPTDTVRTILDRFGPVTVEYECKGAKVVGVFNSTGKDIYWLLNRDEQIELDNVVDDAWSTK